ncbi:hypothetical protein LCGC14_0351140 [marine sediment metagenome]|uniref:Uncharacterized protein n=1 Tax=marine sediment metagenome TaxID=412755 RepID=A0A0F9TAL1_9ZZZZ
MAETEKMTDKQVDATFGDLDQPESDPSEIEVAIPENTPATEEVVEDKVEQDEVTTETPEVSEEVDTSTATEATQEESTPAETTTEETTEVKVEVDIKPEWQDMEKEALIQLLAETEQKRRGFQSESVKSADSLKMLNTIEASTGLPVNDMLSLFTDLNKPEFQQYLQSWYSGDPQDLTTKTVSTTEKSAQSFMPEGKDYDLTDALDPTSESGQAYLKYSSWYNDQQRLIADNRVVQQNIQVSQREAKQYILGQGQDISEFDKYADKFNSPLAVAKLIHAEMVREQNQAKIKNKKADDVLTKVRTNKAKISGVNTVTGVETQEVGERPPVIKELNDVFGDY